jgi:hypothetical protein
MGQPPPIKEHHTYRDIYAFDSTTSIMLSELSSTSLADSPLTIYTHYPYLFYRPHRLRFQIAVLALSLLKSLEIYTLFLLGGTLIGIFSGLPFAFSFFSGVCLEIHDIIISRRPLDIDGHLDLIAASPLPTTKRLLGGPRKVILGASPNPRTFSLWWKFFWIATATLQTLSIVLSYFLLGQKKSDFVFTWAAFQLFWLVARILIFNLTENTHPMADRPMKGSRFEAVSPSMKLRVTNLVLGVAQYQAHAHPRGWDAYLDDSFSTRQIARLLAPENISEVYLLPPAQTSSTSSSDSLKMPSISSFSTSSIAIKTEKALPLAMSAEASRTIKVNILAVIGDTVLSSAAWMLGNSKYSPIDLYDSCIVVFEVTSSYFPSPNLPSSSSTTHYSSPSSLGTFDTEKCSPTPLPPSTHPQTQPHLQTQKRILAIPSARALCSWAPWFDTIAAHSSGGEDALEQFFIPRGGGGVGKQVGVNERSWLYWVPCAFDGEEERWLQIKANPNALPFAFFSSSVPASTSDTTTTNADTNTKPTFTSMTSAANVYSVLGHQPAEVLDDTQLSEILGAGKLNISLKNAQEVREVVDMSRRASEGLRAFLR